MNDDVMNQAFENLKGLSREELIITLFDILTPSEKQTMLQIMLYKYYLKLLFK